MLGSRVSGEGMFESFKASNLLGELARPDSVAEAYLYCMRSDYVDGQVMQVCVIVFIFELDLLCKRNY